MSRRDRAKPAPQSFVASAARVDLSDGKRAKRTLSAAQAPQLEAWDYFDTLSEISFPAIWVGALMQKVVFYAATRDALGNVVHVNSEQSPLFGTAVAVQADFEMSRLKAPTGGQGELNRLGSMNLEIAGDYLLWGRAANPLAQPPQVETWDVLSVREIEPKTVEEGRPAQYLVKRHPEDKGELTGDDDTLIRIWQRHPAWGSLGMSSVISTLTDCDTLLTLSQEIRAQSKSRQGAGLFKVPAELNLKITSSPNDDENSPKTFTQELADSIVTPIENPSDQSAVVPMIVSGPGEYLDAAKFGWVSLGRTTDSSTDTRMDKLTQRIARGIHLPVEVLMGHMGTTFANAAQIGADKFDEYLDPRCRTMADGYSSGFLIPQLHQAMALQAPGTITADQIAQVFVWFDASAIVGSPDPTEDADTLHTNGMISDAAYLRLKGVDSADAASPEERARAIALLKGSIDPAQTAELLRMSGVAVSAPAVPEPTPADQATMTALAYMMRQLEGMQTTLTAGGRDVVQAQLVAAPKPRLDLGRRLVDIDRQLRARVHGAVELAVERMLERAGAKLRSRNSTITASVGKTVSNYKVAAHLGPRLVAAAGFSSAQLSEGAWDRLRDPFLQWTTSAAMDAYDAVVRAGKRGPNQLRRDAYETRAAANARAGWEQLEASLNELVEDLLYAPDADPESFTRVPLALVREALRTAGGWTGTYAVTAAAKTKSSKKKMTTAKPTKPIGEVAFGEDILDILDDEGLAIEGYVWVYGNSVHSFVPHEMLDGTEFINFDDRSLAVAGDFPASAYYYPGDHDGCGCDFQPTIIEGGQ